VPRLRLRSRRLAAPVLALLAAAAPAGAAPLSFRGALSFALPSLPAFAIVEASGVAQVNGTGTGGPLTAFTLPSGVFSTTADFPGTSLVKDLRIAARNGPGAFAGLTGMGGGGAMPLLGSALLCFGATCSAASTILTLPLGVVGAGGSTKAAGPIAVTLDGAAWTKGTFTITWPGAVSIIGGTARGPNGNSGTTAQPGGKLLLVTPVHVHTGLPGFGELPGFGFLSIEFVPEPATALLLGAGLAALGAGLRRTGARG
jgi:hypothetical protein